MMNLYALHSDPKVLLHHDAVALNKYLLCSGPSIAATQLSYRHVKNATSAQYSYYYALNVFKGPFPAGEAAIATIATCTYYSYYYVLDVLKGAFLAGEAAIAKDAEYKQYYEKLVGYKI